MSDDTMNAVCVNSTAATKIYLVIGVEDSIQAVVAELDDLQAGDRIAIAGESEGDGGCFDAALMIARGPINP